MAIYHLSHTYVGKGSQKQPHTAAAHSNYVTRPTRATEVMGERMPTEWRAAATWLKAQEDSDRINARVIDKIEVALPKELDHAQRAALVRDFAEHLSQGRASWLAALHDGPKDEHNPHAHIILRDRDATPGPKAGRRVVLTTERGTVDHIRELWQARANLALEQAGSDARIDHRTLAAQGIEREPQIHVGPKNLCLAEKGVTPESRPAEVQRIDFATGQKVAVTVDYPTLDQGRTRTDYNAEIRARNAAQERARITGRHAPAPAMPADPGSPADTGSASTSSAEEPERKPSPRQEGGEDWTDRGGMAAQQAAATRWAQTANQSIFRRVTASQPERAAMLPKTSATPFNPKERISTPEPPPTLTRRQIIEQDGLPPRLICGPEMTELIEQQRNAQDRAERAARERAASPFTRHLSDQGREQAAAAAREPDKGLER
ncbi:MobA/MobL family protein [Methylobacterium aquaticum]|uniref:MobA/MobL family protein n=1 Tax=Methylobacterium aquaticum TaxID=270351 RepID=UPI003D16F020